MNCKLTKKNENMVVNTINHGLETERLTLVPLQSQQLSLVLEDVDNYLWLTNWAIIHKDEKQIMGYIILKGCPNEFGEVIVGYVVEESHQRKGYATEALRALIQWIFKNPKALFVIADTEKTNIPSHKLLEKLGAVKYKETEELVWWKIGK